MMKKLIIFFIALMLPLFTLFAMILALGGGQEDSTDNGVFTGEFTPELPKFPDIKGTGNFTDEIAQLAVGTAVKYRLLPSVILSQYAYESEWGRSHSATTDNNFFGITWYEGCGFPKGTARGVGGSESGNYMKFPNTETCFSYYGYMVASQNNFNACVSNKNAGDCLLVLGKGGYAAAGITISSPYYMNCMSIIQANKLTERYDQYAIERWLTLDASNINKGSIKDLEAVVGQKIGSGQCYALTAYYVRLKGGPELDGSGKIYASQIGSDYNWSSYEWEVIFNPSFNQLKTGDVINWNQGGIAITPYGHTGIIENVLTNETFTTYEQNSSGEFVSKHTRTMQSAPIASIVRKK